MLLWRGRLWSCDVFPGFIGISGGEAPKTRRFKGKMANFEAKNTVKQGKRRPKDKWYPFHACTPSPQGHCETLETEIL